MVAIHWRTAAIAPNITALAQAGWRTDIADHPVDMQRFWAEWGRGMFGADAGAEAGRIFQNLDGCGPGINGLIGRGSKGTLTDAKIAEFFAPLAELQALRPRIKGTGNLERFDYWLNQIGTSKLRAQTWALSYRLAAKLKEVQAIQDANE